jgi:AraC-like DNA-binding protein
MSQRRGAPGPARGIVHAPGGPGAAGEHARLLPSDDLAPFVAHYWWVRWELAEPVVTETLSHPCVHWVFEVEEPSRRLVRAEIVGVPSRIFRRKLEGKGRVFGIKFRPGAFAPWHNAPVDSLVDRTLAVSALFGAAARELARESCTFRTLTEAIEHTEPFLRARLPELPDEVRAIRDLVERLAVDPDIARVREAAELAGVSVRTLQRRFARYVGVSPKWVIRRYRLHEVTERLRADQPLAKLAAELGYSDQAHLAHDFRATVGRAPSAFAKRKAKLGG